MENKTLTPFYKAFLIAHLLLRSSVVRTADNNTSPNPGQWQLVLNNTGVVPMHMALTRYNTVLMFDRTSSGPSNYRLRRRYDGRLCRAVREDLEDPTCYAHSVEYNMLTNRIRPLFIQPDPWASSGSFLSNGTLLEIGGLDSGAKRVRFYRPCKDAQCDWRQVKEHLAAGRWFSSSLRIPDYNDTIIVVGGKGVSSYEFVPTRTSTEKSIDLPFMKRVIDGEEGNYNLYPILHLSSDGNLFIFANRDSILLDYKNNKIVKTFPRIPGNGSRTYPSSGSSVLLPLDHDNDFQAEVLICGGAAAGAVPAANDGRFLRGLTSCGRMKITGDDNRWSMEQMPEARLLHDMILLPNGDVLIINGAKSGCAGPNRAAEPSLRPFLYEPKNRIRSRFTVLKSTNISRMFQSTAILLPTGKILVAGGNQNTNYVYRVVRYPTELRLELFTPPRMTAEFDDERPRNVAVRGDGGVAYGGEFTVTFTARKMSYGAVFTAYGVPFTTHSVSMNQRLVVLGCNNMTLTGTSAAGEMMFTAVVEAPPSAAVAPAGYYMLSVVGDGIPSESKWIRFINK